MKETLIKAAIDLVVFSIVGVLCMGASTFFMSKFMGSAAPVDVAQASGGNAATPAMDADGQSVKGAADGADGAALDANGQPVVSEEEFVKFSLNSIVVNLAGPERRYAKAVLALKLKEKDVIKKLEKREPEVYDILIKVLSQYKVNELTKSEGKEAFKNEVKERLNYIFGKSSVERVYLTELIIQ